MRNEDILSKLNELQNDKDNYLIFRWMIRIIISVKIKMEILYI